MNGGGAHTRIIAFIGGAVLLGAVAHPAAARQIYQFTDEDGVIHLSDVPPDTDQPISARYMKVEPAPKLRIENVRKNGVAAAQFENLLYGPMQVEVRLEEAGNVTTNPGLPHRFVLPPRFRGPLLTIEPRDPANGYRYRLTASAVPGDPAARHDPSARYLPPFPAGHRFMISQGFEGGVTHLTPDARYAVDIPMPQGTPVSAARDGLIVDVEDDFFEGGEDLKRFGDKANRILVLQEDGTMALYAHLAPESAVIRRGEIVLAGEIIGHSGNTGFSTGPHLHFAVQHNAGMRLEALPFSFVDGNGRSLTPARGMVLEGLPMPR